MCQDEILKILRAKKKNEYVTVNYLERKLKIKKQNIQRAIKQMIAHDEIEVKVCWFRYGCGFIVKQPESPQIKLNATLPL